VPRASTVADGAALSQKWEPVLPNRQRPHPSLAFRLRSNVTTSAVNHLLLRDLLQPVADLWQLLLTYGQRDSAHALVPVVIPKFSPRLADWRPAPEERCLR
jgi:hypothetical protein